MQPLTGSGGAAEVAILEGYPGIVVRMPANATVRQIVAIRAAILAAWQERGNPQKVIVDLTETRHLDSSGVGLLLELWKKASGQAVPLSLFGLRMALRRTLERTGLWDLFVARETGPAGGRAGTPSPSPKEPPFSISEEVWIHDE